ncbi:hypothetical protein LCGC14_0245520 [marine sediment metagenome]|uniref:IrrE N-terminal-like domain-containing protein n=1 Tax=marine sediment metagenome TaxID=412755 RepID=A0A0F9WR05_9ZZZZ
MKLLTKKQSPSIPKEFQLFGKTIKVVFDQERCDADGSYGLALYAESKVLLSKRFDGKDIDPVKIETTFWHEVVHYILNDLRYKKLSEDEVFVSRFAMVLHQVLSSAKI